MSKVNALYHVVFCTKFRKHTLPEGYISDLFRFVWKILESNKCHLYRINGISNHIHMLLNLHPSVALADLMREIKSKSSGWMGTDMRFYLFEGWANEYFAATLAYRDRHAVIEYIKNQQAHHASKTFDEEIDFLMTEECMTMYEGDFR